MKEALLPPRGFRAAISVTDVPVFSVVVPSARAENLVPCLSAVFAHEPELPRDRVIVVDDGAKAGGESFFPDVGWTQGIKPFCYSRNVNLGIRAAGRNDVVLLNDDAILMTPRGLSKLAAQSCQLDDFGIISGVICGFVGNSNQKALGVPKFRTESRSLVFICVYIPRTTFDKIGLLDERFEGYGFEDNDFCLRATRAGLRLGIYEGCVVEHKKDASTYRSRPDISKLWDENRHRFLEKWHMQ